MIARNEDTSTETDNNDSRQRSLDVEQSVPALLVAYSLESAVSVDRCLVERMPFTVGRKSDNCLPINDTTLSKRQFHITKRDGRYWIEDSGSRNGTFVNGEWITKPYNLSKLSSSVVRAGQSIIIFQRSVGSTLESLPKRLGMVGTFHLKSLVEQLESAAISARHILLVGPSGCGKELAAQALAKLSVDSNNPSLVIHNAAHFATEEEASSTLFGVAAGTFSNVDARPGLIEQAEGGVLFLDEIHSLPQRVQRSLLRVIEDGKLVRIGETQNQARQTNVRFIFASNGTSSTYSLVKDLFARLRVVKVQALNERIADIPTIFDHLLGEALESFEVNKSSVMCFLGADHYESLCLDGFRDDNVRGLIDLADRIVTSVANKMPAKEAVNQNFNDRFPDDAVAKRHKGDIPAPISGNLDEAKETRETKKLSHYEEFRDLIIQTYLECKGNVSATERKLKENGVDTTRQRLDFYVEKWRLPSKEELRER